MLKAQRRQKRIRMCIVFACVLVTVTVKSILEMTGVLSAEDQLAGSMMLLIAIFLAVIGGISSLDASKLTKEIDALSRK